MKLLVVTEQPGQSSPYIKAACKAGWQISGESGYGQLPGALLHVQADAAVLLARQVDDVVLHAVRQLNGARPLPVVLYTGDSRQHSMRAAISAGVSVYAVDCSNASRIGALLDVARVRFAETRQLKKELDRARTSLAERNSVEKAKGIIMRQRRVDEDTAYKLIRKLAMDRNRRIGEVAGELIAAAELLV